jgi:hypothetical protein
VPGRLTSLGGLYLPGERTLHNVWEVVLRCSRRGRALARVHAARPVKEYLRCSQCAIDAFLNDARCR